MTIQRILVLDGHSNPALATVRSLGRAGHVVFAASRFRWPVASWSRWCRGAVRMNGFSLAAFGDLRRWAEREGITVLLPMSEESCLLANAHRDAWEALDIRVGCAPDPVLLQAFDKANTLRVALAQGLRVPGTYFPETSQQVREVGAQVRFPCIVKPRFSHLWDGRTFLSSRGNVAVTDAASLYDAVHERRQGICWPLVQEVVRGQQRAALALYDHGRPVAWFASEGLRKVRALASPASLRRSVPVDPRLQEPAERLLTAFRWHGPAMVEFMDDGVNPPWLMEVNGRFWHSLEVGVASGADFPAWWVRILTGERVAPEWEFTPGVTVRWLWGDVKRLLGTLLDRTPSLTGDPTLTTSRALRDLFGPQPSGTRFEMWRADDPAPALGEWLEGLRDIRHLVQKRLRLARAQKPVTAAPAGVPALEGPAAHQ